MTGGIKSKVDKIWSAFWAGGIAKPLEVMEQVTFLLFSKRLADRYTLEKNMIHRADHSSTAVIDVLMFSET